MMTASKLVVFVAIATSFCLLRPIKFCATDGRVDILDVGNVTMQMESCCIK